MVLQQKDHEKKLVFSRRRTIDVSVDINRIEEVELRGDSVRVVNPSVETIGRLESLGGISADVPAGESARRTSS